MAVIVDRRNTFAEQKSEDLNASGGNAVMTFKCSDCCRRGKNEDR